MSSQDAGHRPDVQPGDKNETEARSITINPYHSIHTSELDEPGNENQDLETPGVLDPDERVMSLVDQSGAQSLSPDASFDHRRDKSSVQRPSEQVTFHGSVLHSEHSVAPGPHPQLSVMQQQQP